MIDKFLGPVVLIFAFIGLLTVGAIAWMVIQTKLGCSGAPSHVKFRQGMTLCPGQSAESPK